MSKEPAYRMGRTAEWPEGHRECMVCGDILPFSDFHKHSIGYMGYGTKCKKCRIPTTKENYHKTSIESRLLHNAKVRAIKKGMVFDIDINDIIIQNECPVLKKPYIRHTDMAPSLDRIDNSKGYIKGNVVVMSVRANRLKGDYTIDEFESIISFLKE